jgi:alpha-L-fucosidase 2
LAPLLQPALSRRFVWFTIDYRLAPRHVWPACQEDVATAIRWVKANAARFKGDPDRIALIGYSAGGQLAARAAGANALDTRVQAVVGFAAPTDLTADTARRGGLSTSLMPLFGHTAPEADDDARTKLRQMSAINHIPAAGEGTLPPFLLVHGTADRSVLFDQSVTFQNALRAAGTSAELISLREAPHAIAQWERIDPSYRDAVVAWLETQLTARK